MDAEVFKANLRNLMSSRGLSQKDLAQQIGGDNDGERGSYYRWLRRTASQGLTRCEDRNREQITRICDYFGIHPVERLWSSSLPQLQSVADKQCDMLRYIIQSTTAKDGVGRRYRDGVNADWLMEQIRKLYDALVTEEEIQVRLTNGPLDEVQRQRKRQQYRQANVSNDAQKQISRPPEMPLDGESQTDFFVRLTLKKIREMAAANATGGSSRLLERVGEEELARRIVDALPADIDPSGEFEEAYQRHIRPYLQKVVEEIHHGADDEKSRPNSQPAVDLLSGEKQMDHFVRLSMKKIKEMALAKADGGSSVLLGGMREDVFTDIITQSLPDEIEPSMTFEEAWERYILPRMANLGRDISNDEDSE